MSYRPDRQKNGYCRVWYMSGHFRDLRRADFEQISAAWRTKTEFYEGTNLYGDAVEIRLANVEDIEDTSPAGVVAYDGDMDEFKAYQQTHGEE